MASSYQGSQTSAKQYRHSRGHRCSTITKNPMPFLQPCDPAHKRFKSNAEENEQYERPSYSGQKSSLRGRFFCCGRALLG